MPICMLLATALAILNVKSVNRLSNFVQILSGKIDIEIIPQVQKNESSQIQKREQQKNDKDCLKYKCALLDSFKRVPPSKLYNLPVAFVDVVVLCQ